MRRFLLFFLMVAMAVVIKADDQVLMVWLADGQVVAFNLNEEPVTTYADGKLIIKTTKTAITYPLENVRRYTYGKAEEVPTGISLSDDGETLTFNGLKANTEVAVYTVSGQLVRKMNSGNRSKFAVSVSKLPVGVYVVKANGVTYKISKR